jgi:hypothetical protein
VMFAAGVGCSPNEFQTDRGRFANLLSLKPSTIVHVADNSLKDSLGAREVGMFTVRLRRPDSEYGHLDPPFGAACAPCYDYFLEMLPGLLLPGERKDHLNARY